MRGSHPRAPSGPRCGAPGGPPRTRCAEPPEVGGAAPSARILFPPFLHSLSRFSPQGCAPLIHKKLWSSPPFSLTRYNMLWWNPLSLTSGKSPRGEGRLPLAGPAGAFAGRASSPSESRLLCGVSSSAIGRAGAEIAPHPLRRAVFPGGGSGAFRRGRRRPTGERTLWRETSSPAAAGPAQPGADPGEFG